MTRSLSQSELEQLSAYFDGELPAEEAARIQSLIATDSAWAEALGDLQALDTAMDVYTAAPAQADLAGRIIAAARRERTGSNLTIKLVKYLAPLAAAAAAIVVYVAVHQPVGSREGMGQPVVTNTTDTKELTASSSSTWGSSRTTTTWTRPPRPTPSWTTRRSRLWTSWRKRKERSMRLGRNILALLAAAAMLAATQAAFAQARSAGAKAPTIDVAKQLRLVLKLRTAAAGDSLAMSINRQEWTNLTPDERDKYRREALAFLSKSPEEQEKILKHYDNLVSLSAQKRQAYLQRAQWLHVVVESFTAQERQDLTQLPPDQRAKRLLDARPN